MLGRVQSFPLLLGRDPQADRGIEHFRQAKGDGEGEDEDGHDHVGEELLDEQTGTVTFDQAPVEVATEGGGAGEYADQQAADESADEVHADHIECIVVAESELQTNRKGAQGAGDDAHRNGTGNAHESGARGDADESGDDPGGSAE